MLTRRRFLALTGFSGIAAAGLVIGYNALPSGDEPAGDGPPNISYGSDSCAHCKMIISDARFAAAWRDTNGKVLRFDDIGCMVGMYAEQPPAHGATFWVHSYLDESQLSAVGATFVVSDAITTPMAFGIAATANRTSAERLADEVDGLVQTWDELLATEHGGH